MSPVPQRREATFIIPLTLCDVTAVAFTGSGVVLPYPAKGGDAHVEPSSCEALDAVAALPVVL
jgi:hypothetical protein